ncbi:MAG: LD-carboxypeptidase [Pseudonocardiales bacterium]|nr:MAG: LD-carboxypeptidase [Pseudonocardiales bacterium]
MRPELSVPPKLSPGDRVAILSPSFAAPAVFAGVHELAMRRLREDLELVAVEYPTTRALDASPQARAADVMAAFADPDIHGVLATIGGDDQITVLPYLDPEVARANPKPFFGYSDNTNLLNWLWNLGIAGYHGGSTMVHLGRPVSTHPVSLESLRSALFVHEDVEIRPVEAFGEDEIGWNDPAASSTEVHMTPAPGWTWHQPGTVLTAPTWGGNLEILHWILAADRWVRPVDDYAGCILLLETSEEMPTAQEVSRMLRNAGERGLLGQFPAVLVGRARASNFDQVRPPEQRAGYRAEQRAAVLGAFATYHPEAMIVFDVDFGHTDPQWVLPYGGTMTVDGPARRIVAHY